MDRGAWWATVHGVKKCQTRLKWLSTHVNSKEQAHKIHGRTLTPELSPSAGWVVMDSHLGPRKWVQIHTGDKQLGEKTLAEVIILLTWGGKVIVNLTVELGSCIFPQNRINYSLNNKSLPGTIEGSYYRITINIQLKPGGNVILPPGLCADIGSQTPNSETLNCAEKYWHKWAWYDSSECHVLLLPGHWEWIWTRWWNWGLKCWQPLYFCDQLAWMSGVNRKGLLRPLC